ncbi:C40 family peptidase [Cellulosimicrobium funkei]|nr:C40 family peptidase [Cellulosimicrobium funkei]
MPIAAVEARMAQIESNLTALAPQSRTPLASGLTGTAGAGGIIGSSTGAVPGSAAEQAAQDQFAAQLRQALGGTAAGTAAGAAGAGTGVAGVGSAAGASAASSADSATSSGGTASGNAIVETAKKYLGTPYVWGGNSPSQGFDCSGLVKYVMNELGVDMPRVARDQAKVGTEIGSLAEAQPGDLLGMRNGKHIAIYLGDNKILHAPQPGDDVSIRSLFSWDDIDTIRRVAPAGGSGAASNAGSTRAAFEQLAGTSS